MENTYTTTNELIMETNATEIPMNNVQMNTIQLNTETIDRLLALKEFLYKQDQGIAENTREKISAYHKDNLTCFSGAIKVGNYYSEIILKEVTEIMNLIGV